MSRVPLPAYAFARTPLCFPRKPLTTGTPALHRWLDRNVSDLQRQRFLKRLAPCDRVICDHQIAGQPLLPGAAILEMLRAAAAFSLPSGTVRGLDNVVLKTPVLVREARDVFVDVLPDAGSVRCELCSYSGDQRQVHATAWVARTDEVSTPPAVLALTALESALTDI